MTIPLPSGVSQHTVDTDRIRMRYTQSGDAGGTPVVLVHGNLSTCRFFDELMAACPSGHTFIAPDMRGFGGSEPVAIDATRGLRDWSDDTLALLDALDIDGSFHALGWSTGGGALMQMLIDQPNRLSSLSLVGSVSPHGFGGTNRDGSPCTPDHAGTGGGAAAPDFMAQLRARNLGLDSPFAIRNVIGSQGRTHSSAAVFPHPPFNPYVRFSRIRLTDDVLGMVTLPSDWDIERCLADDAGRVLQRMDDPKHQPDQRAGFGHIA